MPATGVPSGKVLCASTLADLSRPQPLYNEAGEPRLADSLRAIEAEHGSVLAYLDKELGVDAADIERLRALYAE